MAWNDYAKMTRNQRRALVENALKGDSQSVKEFVQYTRDIKTESNKRLRELERSNLDYGPAYNTMMYFLQIQYNGNRLLSPTALNNELWDMFTQNEQALRFLKNKASDRTYARNVENHRIKTLKEHEILPENFTRRKNIEFLRFLGNEEVSATIEQYGSSDTIVDELYKAYEELGNDAFRIAGRALAEFLDGRIKFNDAMKDIKKNVEDHFKKRQGNSNT